MRDGQNDVASWDRELDVVTPEFARHLRMRADPKVGYDASYQLLHVYAWDFRAKKIVCAARVDLAGGAADAGTIAVRRRRGLVTKAGTGKLWIAGARPGATDRTGPGIRKRNLGLDNLADRPNIFGQLVSI